MLIPCLQIAKGQVVGLRNGNALELIVESDPLAVAREYGRAGELALVDLDAARGVGDNTALIEEICCVAECRVGGGIRDVDRAQRLLRAGARKLIIGTMADPDFLSELNAARLIAAIDTRDGRLVDHGWTVVHVESPVARARRLEPYVSGYVYTIVERQGSESGLDLDRVRTFARSAPHPVTVAGGAVSVREVVDLDRIGIDVQAATGVYKGRFSPAECLVAIVDFARGAGSVPTVVQDAGDSRVLSVDLSTRETLTASLREGAVVLAGHPDDRDLGDMGPDERHRLVRVEVDNDRDALLFHVAVDEPAPPEDSEFGPRRFTLAKLQEAIANGAHSPIYASYSRRLLEDSVARRAKILEEATELIEARSAGDAQWEAADLLYHVLVELQARGIPIERVVTELDARRRRTA